MKRTRITRNVDIKVCPNDPITIEQKVYLKKLQLARSLTNEHVTLKRALAKVELDLRLSLMDATP